ncbi:MAG TPA: sugar phosphate isomerase/epimerase [Opitutus sp.]|nr:sugar phosphate isomerase/epimerase [Opitutus sp.]
MPYRRAFSTLGCAESSLPDALALAARHGLDGLELRALGGTLDLPAYLHATYGTPAKLAAALHGAAVRITVLDSSLRLAGATAADRAGFLDFVPWAEALGVPWLRVFDGECAAGEPGAGEAAAALRWWRDLRQARGWRVDCAIETHDALLTSAEILRFVAAAPGAKILWDTHHTWKLGGEDPLATWRAIRPHVAHVHVKDSVTPPGAGSAHAYTLPGRGEFPMGALAPVLRREFTGSVSLEWERLWHPELPPLESALESAATTAWW